MGLFMYNVFLCLTDFLFYFILIFLRTINILLSHNLIGVHVYSTAMQLFVFSIFYFRSKYLSNTFKTLIISSRTNGLVE